MDPLDQIRRDHTASQKRRSECGYVTGASSPAGVSAAAGYGPRIRTLGIYLVCHQHSPFERAAEIRSDWARAVISVGTLQAFVAQGADGLAGFLGENRGQLVSADVGGHHTLDRRIPPQDRSLNHNS